MAGRRFRRYTHDARQKPELWRLGLGIVLAIATAVLTGIALVLAAAWIWPGAVSPTQPEVMEGTPGGTMLFLATTFGMGLGAMAAATLVHGRSVKSLFGPATRVLRDFAVAAGIALAALGLSLAGWAVFFDAEPGLDRFHWVSLLPLTVLLLIAQTGAEELLFRGYLMQQLAARFASPLIWMVLPALIFGLAHSVGAPTPGFAVFAVVATGLFGLLAADLTAVTGSLGAAWGFHFANNLISIAFLSTKGAISGLALWLTPYDAGGLPPLTMIGDLAIILGVWWLIRSVVAR